MGNKDTIRQSSLINIILITLLAIVEITPLFSRILNPRVQVVIFALWVMSSVLTVGLNNVFNDKNKVAFWWCVLISWQLFLAIIGYSTTYVNVFVQRISIYLIPVIGVYCISYFNKKELIILFVLLLGMLTYNLVDNVVLGRSTDFFEQYAAWEDEFISSNAGKSGFVSTMMYLSALMFVLFLSARKLAIKIISSSIALLSAYYVFFVNSRATATVLLLLLVIGVFYVHRRGKRTSQSPIAGYVFFVVILFVLIMPFFDSIVALLPERTAVRLNSFTSAVSSGVWGYESDDSFSTRFQCALISLKTWISSPVTFLLGKGEDSTTDGSFYNLMKLGIGQHSQFIDFLAMYGIFGAFLLYRALKSTSRFVIQQCFVSGIEYKAKIIFFIFLLQSVLNNTLFSGEFTLLTIMLPILIALLNPERKNIYF